MDVCTHRLVTRTQSEKALHIEMAISTRIPRAVFASVGKKKRKKLSDIQGGTAM